MRRSFPAFFVALLLAATTAVIAGPWTAPATAAPADVPLDAPALRRPASGYWMVAGDGGVFAFGDAGFHGSTGNLQLAAPVVGAAATPSGGGYWMVARDGGIFAFGDAGFHGSTGAMRLNQPIVGMAATPSGKGYWLVARDGGIFAFGDALFFGSTGAIALNQPIVGMAATPSGKGYWLVARDGGIFAFGDAVFHGSTGDRKLNAPIVAMTSSPSGGGYWLVATDGGIFTFGDAAFLGSTGAIKLNKPIVSMAATAFGGGYWLVASDGGVFAFGDAAFFGSTGNLQLASPVVAIAVHPRALSAARTAIFYYPWYGTPTDDAGEWRHWEDPNPDGRPGPFTPPDDIASNFYPARGVYSSRNAAVLDAQMAEIAAMGVSTVVVSWWGPGSAEDAALPAVVAAARARGLTPAVHIEPYSGRTVDHVGAAVARLISQLSIGEFWIYLSDGPSADAWRVVTDTYPAARFWGHSHRAFNAMTSLFPAYAANAGFDGVYTYDPLPYAPESFGRVCAQARARGLLCSPSVNPGYDDRRIRGTTGETRGRDSGARYDAYWRGAFSAGADVVSITSYNEWHEGTQIEAAAPRCTLTGGSCYSNYAGAYGITDAAAAAGAYVERTRMWVAAMNRAAEPAAS